MLVLELLVNGCAAVPLEGAGGSGPVEQPVFAPGSSQWEGLEEARRAELESALLGMWGLIGGVREVGAVVELNFWAEGGAFTLLSMRRREWGKGLGSVVEPASFAGELRRILPTYIEGAAGMLRLTLRREEGRWRADFKLETEAELPPEAKTWPVRQVGVRAEVLERLVATGREVASRVWAPAGAQVRWQVDVELEDERIEILEIHPPRSLPGGKSVRTAPEMVGTWVNVLAPFTKGFGTRKVRLEWEGSHIAGSGLSRWSIVAAEVVSPPPPAPENAEVALAYRAMHERIQREWREQTREGFVHMGLIGAEQVALLVVGGVLARGLAVVVEAAAPMITRVLMKGGTYAVGWFRSLVVRAVPADKQVLSRLLAKIETQGMKSLTASEGKQLQAVFMRLEELPTIPLNDIPGAKDRLRRDASAYFYEKMYPGFSSVLRDSRGVLYDVHHCIPLQHAHRFPLRDVNAANNLVAAAKPVHVKINNVWARAQAARKELSVAEIEEVERIVRKHFGRWFNKAFDAKGNASQDLAAAERAALEEMQMFLRNAR